MGCLLCTIRKKFREMSAVGVVMLSVMERPAGALPIPREEGKLGTGVP